MVKIGDASVIRTVADSCFHRFNIISHISENKIVVTEGAHISTVYDLSTKTLLKSWNFPESSPLSAPVIFDNTTDSFVAVQDNSKIVRFDMNQDLSEASKLKLKENIYCLFCHPKKGTIVLFANGCFKSSSNLAVEQNIVNVISPAKESIVWAHIDPYNKSDVILFLVSETTDGKHVLRKLRLEDENEEVKEISCVALKQTYNFFTFSEERNVVALDAKLRLTCLLESEMLLMQLPSEYENQLNSISFLSNSKLISVVKTKFEQNNFKLQVWDLNFKLIIAETLLDLFPLLNAISVNNNNIFICCSKGITVIPFDEKQVSLASVLGKAAVVEKNKNDETNLEEILGKMDFSAPQSRERLQVSALRICLKQDMSSDINVNQLVEILKFSFSESFAIQSLKDCKFSVEEVTKLLQILNSVLMHVKNLFVVDWICVIMDAYFKQLILSSNKSTVNILQNILETVQSIGNYCEKLQELRYFLEGYGLTINRTQIRDLELPKYKVGQYCIEVVHF